jgi:hypothetical protein
MPGSGVGVEIESHWLGGRRLSGRWEIADIALVIIVRQVGMLIGRKFALFQSKRLYSREIPVHELDRADYMIGIGRLIDRTEPTTSLTRPRSFGFSEQCIYRAMAAGSEQIGRIDDYMQRRNLSVYYSLYNPPRLPFKGVVPRLTTGRGRHKAILGCRILPAEDVHAALATLPAGRQPMFRELAVARQPSPSDRYGVYGWRLEVFVADELLRCRQGRVFEEAQHPDLRAVLYERAAPIAAAIAITLDLPGEG